MQITQIVQSDFESVLALNEDSIPHVNPIGVDELQWFADHAAFVRVAKEDGRLAGFIIGLRPGIDYASPNYRWFCANYDNFAYIDRVAVNTWARRRRVAESLYQAFETSQPGVPFLTCEVNIRPPNAGSMLFHQRMGFQQVGSQLIDDGKKEVALMEKIL
jgi:predicted GNAT superfamily acetyltransferase